MKRIFVMLLSGVLIASALPMNSYAAADVNVGAVADSVAPDMIKAPEPAGSSVEPTTKGLEEAILAVKGKVDVPKEYSQFNYNFYDTSSYSDAYWNLTWSNPSNNSYIQVNCDADYHITYFSQYDYSNKTTGVAKYLKSELKPAADEFISKIAPELTGKLEYLEATYEGTYSGNYCYKYQRRNNGVAFPDNTVSVWVNSISGKVTSVSVSWLYDGSVPSSKVSISKEAAIKLIKDNMKMKLVYRSNYYHIYDTKGNDEGTKAFLVYEPTQDYISIDAKTGEVYLTRSEWVDTKDYNGANKETAATADSAATGSTNQALTEEEISKIEELKGVISKQKAIDIVTGNPNLYLDKNLKSYTASLSKIEKAGETSYVWYVSLSDPRTIDYTKDTDYYRAYASATVDAKTGKILSFYASMKSYYNEATKTWEKVAIPYTKEEGQAILEKFFKAQIKDRFENSTLVSSNDDYVVYYDKKDVPVYGGYSYQYNRINEGVEYPYNYLHGSVDGVTGKIYSFSSYWDDSVVFESTKGAMSADKAMDYYLANDGFGLKYEINVINKYDSSYSSLSSYYEYNDAYSVEYEIRLVYRPDVNPDYISPFTGEQLTYDGKVYKEAQPYSYQDIKDIPENRNILLLADMNIGLEGDNFLPDQAITVSEMNLLLQSVGYGYGYNAKDDINANNQITREELAKVFITKMGLDKLSKLSGIFTTGYADEKNIGKDYLGSVALAKGLGLMTGDADNNFNPRQTITRKAAVDLIMNFIAAQQDSLYY